MVLAAPEYVFAIIRTGEFLLALLAAGLELWAAGNGRLFELVRRGAGSRVAGLGIARCDPGLAVPGRSPTRLVCAAGADKQEA